MILKSGSGLFRSKPLKEKDEPMIELGNIVKDDIKEKRIIGTKCPECGYKIRGKNHDEGDHHKSGGKGKGKKKY